MMKYAASIFMAGVMAMGLAFASSASADEEWPLGVQAFSFRHFTLYEAIGLTRALGLNYVESYPGQRLRPDSDVTISHELSDEDRQALLAYLDEMDMTLAAYGVVGLSANEDETRPIFEFADAMGIEILSANPHPDALDLVESLAEEFGVYVAIHNHGPGARYDSVDDVLNAVEGRNAYLGACVDTGHFIRSEEPPHEAVERLGERVHSLHLKDWTFGGPETAVGEGDMDLEALAAALEAVGFEGPIMLEYELDPENPGPGMARGVANWREAAGG